MKFSLFSRTIFTCLVLWFSCFGNAHPLRLSLCEIEYESKTQILTISLRLFLMDVNEALTFDPDNNELALGQANEVPEANQMLIDYLDEFFFVKVNDSKLELAFTNKRINGVGDNTALGLDLHYSNIKALESLEVKNAIFTDLFFDQNNIIYVHVNGDSKSLMLNKKTPIHKLVF